MKGLQCYKGLLLAVLMVSGGSTLLSQENFESIGKISFTPVNQSGALPANVWYGFGTQYTDTTDEGEVEIPFLPPQSYYAWLKRPCDGPFAGDPCIWQEDFRGVPDSVLEGEQTRFSLEFTIGLRNNTGGALRLSILNPDWPPGVDSIHLVDPVVPTAFNKTFTGPAVALIEDQFTTRLTMTVYYNLRTLSVQNQEQGETEESQLLLTPNPVQQGPIIISGEMNAGDRLLVVNSRGETVLEHKLEEFATGTELGEDLSAGPYFLLHLDSEGVLRGRQSFLVIR